MLRRSQFPTSAPASASDERLARLEAELAQVKRDLEALRRDLGA